jgi:hypothetical protein
MSSRNHSRGQIQLVDVMMTFFVLVAILATAPFWSQFQSMVIPHADGLSELLLQLALPLLFLSLIVSVGVSARRGNGGVGN